MAEVAVYNIEGEQVDTMQVDEALLGGSVNPDLIKQAVVTYHANRRQGTSATRSRGQVAGSTRKLFRQKGTGNARRGAIRTNIMRGGGVAFGKTLRSYRKRLPKKMRRAARNSAILAKIVGGDLVILDALAFEAPQTAEMARILTNLDIHRSCLLALAERDTNVYLSGRNLPDLTVRTAEELNAHDVATRQKMIATRQAMAALLAQPTPQEVTA